MGTPTGYIYYSDSRALHSTGIGLIGDDIPERVRNGVENYLLFLISDWTEVWQSIVLQLNWSPEELSGSGHRGVDLEVNQEALRKAIQSKRLPDWLDMMTAVYVHLAQCRGRCTAAGSDSGGSTPQDRFLNRVNELFTRYYSAFQMEPDGSIVELGAHVTEAAIAEARAILMSPDLAGPDRQFQEAVTCLVRRPTPNPEGAVTNATNAVEGVIRIALDDPRVTLGDGSKNLMRKYGMDGSLMAAMNSLYGYASNKGGRHGLTGEADADLVIAEYVVHQAAAAIVFIAGLQRWTTVRASVTAPTDRAEAPTTT